MSNLLPYATPTISYADRAASRIIWRLVPFLCLLFIVNYLDRTNVAMAKVHMLDDLKLNEAVYGLGAGLFFIGYFIFEVPSNLILERVGARRWIARIMITWGIISAAMMFVRGPHSFYLLRFLLGVAEAGFFPGGVLYLTYWVPQRRRAGVLAAFLTSTAVSGVIGNPLSGALMDGLDKVGGLHGWQWLFLIEGMLPVALGFVVLFVLTDRPGQAHWLTDEEKQSLEDELRLENAPAHHHVSELTHALVDLRLWLLSAIYFCCIMGFYGFIFWMPTIIKDSIPGSSALRTGLLAAIPSFIGAVAMVLIGMHSDKAHERRKHVAGCAIVAAIGFVMVTRLQSGLPMQISLGITAVGAFGFLGPFWSLTTGYFKGSACAGGIAIVNSIGGFAGFVSPTLLGYVKTHTGHLTYGLLIVAAVLVCGAVLVMGIPSEVDAADRGFPVGMDNPAT